jgi:uncharacterized protein (UPF0332 family)
MNIFSERAWTAARSARALLALGDTNGAISRAYYAMFDAARSALYESDPKLIDAKTHGTIIRRFGMLTRTTDLASDLGRAFNVAENVRIQADYHFVPVDIETANAMVGAMEEFVVAVVGPPPTDGKEPGTS